jgi:hypothetical protein
VLIVVWIRSNVNGVRELGSTNAFAAAMIQPF